MTWDPKSNTAGLIVGFGMMLVSGFFLYLEYLSYRELHKKDAKNWLVWETIWELIFSFTFGNITKLGFFLFGLLIVVLIILQFFGVVH